jgi:Fe-S-cluster containining protein
MLSDALPALYRRLLPAEFLEQVIDEPKATCADCYKLKPTAPLPHFHAATKCCTFYPFLPNYLVGSILLDGSAPGREVLRSLLRDRGYTVPIGVCAPPAFQALFLAKEEHDFGRRPDLRCPFYVASTGRCGIWAQRGHQCSTYFCVSVHGDRGERFWQEVRDYLHEVEIELAQEAMVQLGFGARALDRNLSLILDRDPKPGRWRLDQQAWTELWEHERDDIESYYVRCYEIATTMTEHFRHKAFPVFKGYAPRAP